MADTLCSSVQTRTTISICIVNWNTRIYLEECLGSLHAVHSRAYLEIIVVDNDSSDGSADMVRSKFPDVTLIHNAQNLKYAAANNQAFEISTGEYVLILNPDTIIPNNIFDPLIAKMKTDPQIGVLSCQLRNPDGSIQGFCSGLPTLADEIFLQTGLDQLYPDNPVAAHQNMSYFDYETESDVEQPPGTCMLVRRAVLDQVSGFDEQFPIFYNDVDLCRRIIDNGWKIVYTPDVYIYHHKSASIRNNLEQYLTEAFYMRKRYFSKQYGRLTTAMLSVWSPFIGAAKKSDEWPAGSIKRILLIKSSFDSHFDELYCELKKRYSQTIIDLLTTRACDTESTELQRRFNTVYLYAGHGKRIDYFHTAKMLKTSLKKQQYDAIFFPHASVDGAGYWNILFFSLFLTPRYIGAYGVNHHLSIRRIQVILWIRGALAYFSAHLLLRILTWFYK